MKTILVCSVVVLLLTVCSVEATTGSHIDAALAAAQKLLARDGHLLVNAPSLAELREEPIKPATPPPPGAAEVHPTPITPQPQGNMVMVPTSMAGVPDASGEVLPAIVPSGTVTPVPNTQAAAAKLVTDPEMLVTPVIALPVETPVETPKPEKPIEANDWAAAAMSERRNPSDHLIQQTIAKIKHTESRDVGELAPGLKLGYEHSYHDEGLASAHVERPSLTDKKLHGDEGLDYLGVERARLGVDGPQKKLVGAALQKMGHLVNDLAKRVAQVDELEENLMHKVMGGNKAALQGDAKEAEMVRERAEAHRLKRETEVAALVRNEVQVLTDQMHTELRVLKTKFFAQLKEMLRGLRSNLQTEFVRQKEHDEKMEAIAEGKFKSESRENIDEENIMSPARMKARLNLDISRRINEAFNRMAAVRKTIVAKNLANGAQGEHVNPSTRAEETAAMLRAHGTEPTAAEMKQALGQAAEEERKNAAKDADPRAAAKQDGETAQAVGDEAAQALKLDELSRTTESAVNEEQRDDDNAVHDKERQLVAELAALRAQDNAQTAEEKAHELQKGEDEGREEAAAAEAEVDQMEKTRAKEELKKLAQGSFLEEQEDQQEEEESSPNAIAEQLKRMWQRRVHRS